MPPFSKAGLAPIISLGGMRSGVPGLFTFARLEKQEIDAFGVTNPLSQFALVALDRARVDTAELGANLWFLERFGLSTRFRRFWSDNESFGANQGLDVPLVPEHTVNLRLSWVHTRQIRVDLSADYLESVSPTSPIPTSSTTPGPPLCQ